MAGQHDWSKHVAKLRALYQGVAAIFIAQIYGMDLGIAEQATIVGSATLASIGAAGVPGAGMITLAMVLTAIGVPAEGLALVLGVDRLLDIVNLTITDKDRRFVPLGSGPVIGSWVRGCLHHLKIQGMILETTFKAQPLSLRTRQHRLLVNEVLGSLEMIDGSQVDTLLDPRADAISVGIFDGSGASSGGVNRFIKLIGHESDM